MWRKKSLLNLGIDLNKAVYSIWEKRAGHAMMYGIFYHGFAFLANSSTSSMFSGRGDPNVSGRKTAKTPPISALDPMMMKESDCGFSPARSGAITPPTRAMVEEVPTAVLRMVVG